ncbi:hypothetical protein VP01_1974g4 [Puccinia sorghi]|uniref:Uncharacterized protein n=1 Tax=Puccinia sorghi TaxID=27349 RepID=A0A0L6VBX7_9BASI|nr:hypothetical protein VP01_1974g4 [Puccinia sorghi]
MLNQWLQNFHQKKLSCFLRTMIEFLVVSLSISKNIILKSTAETKINNIIDVNNTDYLKQKSLATYFIFCFFSFFHFFFILFFVDPHFFLSLSMWYVRCHISDFQLGPLYELLISADSSCTQLTTFDLRKFKWLASTVGQASCAHGKPSDLISPLFLVGCCGESIICTQPLTPFNTNHFPLILSNKCIFFVKFSAFGITLGEACQNTSLIKNMFIIFFTRFSVTKPGAITMSCGHLISYSNHFPPKFTFLNSSIPLPMFIPDFITKTAYVLMVDWKLNFSNHLTFHKLCNFRVHQKWRNVGVKIGIKLVEELSEPSHVHYLKNLIISANSVIGEEQTHFKKCGFLKTHQLHNGTYLMPPIFLLSIVTVLFVLSRKYKLFYIIFEGKYIIILYYNWISLWFYNYFLSIIFLCCVVIYLPFINLTDFEIVIVVD